jgi:hypothetical protein
VQPETPAELLAGKDAPVCYVLEQGGLADTLALERLCQIHGLPSPLDELQFAGILESGRNVVLRRDHDASSAWSMPVSPPAVKNYCSFRFRFTGAGFPTSSTHGSNCFLPNIGMLRVARENFSQPYSRGGIRYFVSVIRYR